MSLISLTFGDKTNQNKNYFGEVSRPGDNIQINPNVENKVVVKKACRFYGMDSVYVMGEVVSGYVSVNMKGVCNNKIFNVLELECKYPGVTCAKKGMKVGLMVHGISEDDLMEGDTITFC